MERKAKKSTKSPAKSSLGIIPAPGYLLIEPFEVQTKTDSGIYLPDSATGEKPQKGKVLAVGSAEVTESGAKKEAPASAGDIVYYKKWGGSEVKMEGKEYLFAKFEDVLAIEK